MPINCVKGHEVKDPLSPCPDCLFFLKSYKDENERLRLLEKRLDQMLHNATHKKYLTPAEKDELVTRINEFILGMFPVMDGSSHDAAMVFNENRTRNYHGKIISAMSPEELHAFHNRCIIMLSYLREQAALLEQRVLVKKRQEEKETSFKIAEKFDRVSKASSKAKISPREKMIKKWTDMGISLEQATSLVDAALATLVQNKS